MIERASLRLFAAVHGLEELRHTIALIRPDRGTKATLHRINDVEAAVRGALHDLASHSNPADEEPGAEVERRALLRLAGTAAATLLTPMAPLKHIADAIDHPRRVDPPLLDALNEVTTTYAKAFYNLPPAQLLRPVRAHLDRLVVLTGHSTTPALRSRLETMISDTAIFAGTLAYHLDQLGLERAYLTLAADAAHQAGDATLHALALASLGISTAHVRPGDPRASDLLDQAYQTLPEHAPRSARTWLAVHYATDCAANSDQLGYDAAIDVAQSALHQPPTEPTSGFCSDTGSYRLLADPNWFHENAARGMVTLRRPGAEPLLLRLADTTANPRVRIHALHSLTLLYTQQGEIPEACRTAIDALHLARAHGLAAPTRKIRTARDLMRHHEPSTAIQELDDALGLRLSS